jgi:hypothetical protein
VGSCVALETEDFGITQASKRITMPLDVSSVNADRPSSLPTAVSMSLNGFESEEGAQKFSELLFAYLSVIGRDLNLERLVEVTVGYDYQAALASVDRGVKNTTKLTATSETYGIGVAMTPAVLRDGELKSHMVFNANVLRGIEGEEINRDLLYLIAHECGHVHDLKVRDEAFPNILMKQRYLNLRQDVLGRVAAACWEEYAACFLSAAFSSDETTDGLAEVFIEATKGARERANDAIKRYRMHGDIPVLVSEVGSEYGNALKFAAYLLGQLHGLGKPLADCRPAYDFISDHWCLEFVERLDAALTSLMDNYGQWSDIAEFEILQTIADDLLQDGGIFISEVSDDQVSVVVPFTPETTP